MIPTFIRFKQGKIMSQETKKPVTVNHIIELMMKKEDFHILEAESLKDIKEEVLAKLLNNKKKMRMAKNTKVYGPEEPLYSPKKYSCKVCTRPTHNRYRCSECWETVSNENFDGNYVYHII